MQLQCTEHVSKIIFRSEWKQELHIFKIKKQQLEFLGQNTRKEGRHGKCDTHRIQKTFYGFVRHIKPKDMVDCMNTFFFQ